jgi:hypothetical protein
MNPLVGEAWGVVKYEINRPNPRVNYSLVAHPWSVLTQLKIDERGGLRLRPQIPLLATSLRCGVGIFGVLGDA